MTYNPDYETGHIRTSLKKGEYHPAEIYAGHVINSLPREYVENITKGLAHQLEEEPDHALGVVWSSLNRILNGEEIHGRYLMGVALYLAYTLFNVGATAQKVLQTMAQQMEATDDEFHPSDEEVELEETMEEEKA